MTSCHLWRGILLSIPTKTKLKSLVLVGMCCLESWKWSHTYTNFPRKCGPFHTPIGPILGKMLTKFPQFFSNFLNFGLKLGNFWKIDLFIYHIFHWYTRRLIFSVILAAHPCRVFFSKVLPPPPVPSLIWLWKLNESWKLNFASRMDWCKKASLYTRRYLTASVLLAHVSTLGNIKHAWHHIHSQSRIKFSECRRKF